MGSESKSSLEVVATTAQVLSVVVGVVISVLSFNAARAKEADARRLEAAKPYLALRQTVYLDTVKAAAVLANSDLRARVEIEAAKKRFRDLYVAELAMVESPGVELEMVRLAQTIDPSLVQLTTAQRAALDLSHALRASYVPSWGLDVD